MIPEFSTTAPRDGFRSDTATPPATIPCDALVVFVTDDAPAGGAAAEIDRATGGLLGRLAAAGEITGKRYECTPILAPAGIAAGQLLVVGQGSKAGLDQGTLYRAAAAATRLLAGRRRASVALVADRSWSARQVEQAVAGSAVGMVGQDLYRAEKKRTPFGSTVWSQAPADAVATGTLIADGVNLARRLVNMAPEDLYPESFAEAAATIALPPGFTATLAAAEPAVQNPIAMAWDARGRLWVAENYTYAERTQRFDLSLRDRVLILKTPTATARSTGGRSLPTPSRCSPASRSGTAAFG